MHVDKLEQARVNDALGRDGISNVKVAQAATFVGKPSSPKKPLLLALGLFAALGAALAIPFVTEIFDETLRTTDQVESELGLPVLLSFPYRKRRQKRLKADGQRREVARAVTADDVDYRILARELLVNNGSGNGQLHAKAVGVMGCEAEQANNCVAADLAIEAANCGTAPVLLIDGDERRRSVAQQFGLNGSPGWHEMLAGVADVQNCVHSANDGRLDVMTPGQEQTPANGGQAVAGRGQLDELKQKYGLVVVDLPAAAEFDSGPSANWFDESVLVVEAEHTRIQSAKRAKSLLERAGIRVSGVVLANRREHIPRWLYDRL
jgi:Mrp family chromosome partitioning ATPase